MKTRILYGLPPVFVLAVGLLVWEALASAGRLDPFVFPAPSEIVASGINHLSGSRLWPHVRSTATALLTSFVVAVVAGTVLGLVIGRSRRLYELLYPGIAAFYGLPKVTVFPIFMLFFGLGLTQRTLFGAFFGVFPLLVNTIAGIHDLDENWLRLAESLGMNRRELWRKIVLPGVLPMFATGTRLAFVYAGIGVLLSEMFVAPRGLGQLLVSTAGSIRMASYFFYTTVVFIAFALVTTLLRKWEARLGQWRKL